jgi:hypothetical protein
MPSDKLIFLQSQKSSINTISAFQVTVPDFHSNKILLPNYKQPDGSLLPPPAVFLGTDMSMISVKTAKPAAQTHPQSRPVKHCYPIPAT